MGEKENQPFQLCFNASLRVDFQGSRVTSDGGLILVREWDERLGFGDLIREHLTDPRRGKNTQSPLADLLRQSVYGRLAVHWKPAAKPGSKSRLIQKVLYCPAIERGLGCTRRG